MGEKNDVTRKDLVGRALSIFKRGQPRIEPSPAVEAPAPQPAARQDAPLVSRKELMTDSLAVFRRGVTEHVHHRITKNLDGPVRPPGALEEVEFLTTCTRCDACIAACPHQAILKMPPNTGFELGTPYIDTQTQACHACPDTPCIAVCEPGALKPTPIEQAQMGTAVINPESCHTFHDKVCTKCYDACPYPERAISIDANFQPNIMSACIGCGLCEKYCPVHPSGVTVLSPLRLRKASREDAGFFGLLKDE